MEDTSDPLAVVIRTWLGPFCLHSERTMEFRWDEEDAILPVRITHHSEQLWNGTDLEHNYNYLVYEFETEQHSYRARSYLDDIQTVSVYGPFDKGASYLAPLSGVQADQRVLDYLRRRYRSIQHLGSAGYVPIE